MPHVQHYDHHFYFFFEGQKEFMTTIMTCTDNLLTCGIIFPYNVNKSKKLSRVIIVCFKKKHIAL